MIHGNGTAAHISMMRPEIRGIERLQISGRSIFLLFFLFTLKILKQEEK